MKQSGVQRARQSTRKKIKKSLGPDFLDPSNLGLHGKETQSDVRCDICHECFSNSSKRESIACRKCPSTAHSNCVKAQLNVKYIKSLWLCLSCRHCYECDESDVDQSELIFCRTCDLSYHYECVRSIASSGGKWICLQCKKPQLPISRFHGFSRNSRVSKTPTKSPEESKSSDVITSHPSSSSSSSSTPSTSRASFNVKRELIIEKQKPRNHEKFPNNTNERPTRSERLESLERPERTIVIDSIGSRRHERPIRRERPEKQERTERSINIDSVVPKRNERPITIDHVAAAKRNERPINIDQGAPKRNERPMNIDVIGPKRQERPLNIDSVAPKRNERPITIEQVASAKRPINLDAVAQKRERPMNNDSIGAKRNERPMRVSQVVNEHRNSIDLPDIDMKETFIEKPCVQTAKELKEKFIEKPRLVKPEIENNVEKSSEVKDKQQPSDENRRMSEEHSENSRNPINVPKSNTPRGTSLLANTMNLPDSEMKLNEVQPPPKVVIPEKKASEIQGTGFVLSKPVELTEETARLLRDSNGAKRLKLVLFERACKAESLLPAETNIWTVEDVSNFIKFVGFPDAASNFFDHQIDGKSLLLLSRKDVLTGFKLKLGPALKIYAHIFRLQRKRPALLLMD